MGMASFVHSTHVVSVGSFCRRCRDRARTRKRCSIPSRLPLSKWDAITASFSRATIDYDVGNRVYTAVSLDLQRSLAARNVNAILNMR